MLRESKYYFQKLRQINEYIQIFFIYFLNILPNDYFMIDSFIDLFIQIVKDLDFNGL